MSTRRKLLIAFLLLSVYLTISLLASRPMWVESEYSLRLYSKYSALLRTLFGSVRISLGDVLYGILAVFIVIGIVRFFIKLFRREKTKQQIIGSLMNLVIILLVVVIVFRLSWGLNYSRQGISHQLHLQHTPYGLSELKALNRQLVEKVNACKQQLVLEKTTYPENDALFSRTIHSYHLATLKYPYLYYRRPALKSSLWGWLGNYWGFTGYYNPFTGEAQLNTTVPRFLLPYAACHEVAHQLGYAKEKEANFVAYLVAKESGDSLLLYSTYFDLFLYANRNLFATDSISAKLYRDSLSFPVKEDIATLVTFNRRHRNFMEPIVTAVYDWFLRSNRQPQGMLSYDEVTALLIAYEKKQGDL